MVSSSDTSSDEKHSNECTRVNNIFSDGDSTSYASLIPSMAAIANLLATVHPEKALSWCCTHQLLNTLFEIYLV